MKLVKIEGNVYFIAKTSEPKEEKVSLQERIRRIKSSIQRIEQIQKELGIKVFS